MKRNLQRIVSIWAAVLMVFNIVTPTFASAAGNDPSATYQTGLDVADLDGTLTPQSILGPAVEYGVVAEKYKQTGHTETNFAVKRFEINDSQSIEIMGSGSNPIPFYIGKLDNNTTFWNGESTNVVFDVYINKNQSSKGLHNTGKNVEYSRTEPATNVIPMEETAINKYVDSLLNYAVASSTNMAKKIGNEATCIPTFENQWDKSIDFTAPGFPKTGTIYVDCSNMAGVMNQDGWNFTKYEGQTIVFNMPSHGSYEIKKFAVTVKDKNGNIIESNLTSDTKERDGNGNANDRRHNQKVEKYILNHVVFNAYNASSLSIDTAAGIFLAPNANVTQTGGAGAGWVITKKEFNSPKEWHYYFRERHYQAFVEKGINISKTFTYQDGSELPSDITNKQFTFRMDEVDGNTFQIKDGNNTYHETVTGKAGDKIEFPKFGISNKNFTCKQNGEIDGDQRITQYYVIQEVADSDDTIVTDGKKIYVKLEAHGYDKDKIDLKVWRSEDHQNWGNEVGEHGNVGTFNNYKSR